MDWRRSWRGRRKTRRCDSWKQSEAELQDQLYEMLLMGQVKCSCKLPSGLGTVEAVGDLDQSSTVWSCGLKSDWRMGGKKLKTVCSGGVVLNR